MSKYEEINNDGDLYQIGNGSIYTRWDYFDDLEVYAVSYTPDRNNTGHVCFSLRIFDWGNPFKWST